MCESTLRAFAFAVLLILAGHVQAWQPTKPLNIVVPSAVGSGNDVAFRPISRAFEALKIPHVFEHIPGVGGAIATNYFKKSKKPDGHSLLIYGVGQYGAELDYKDVVEYSYDDFVLVTQIAKTAVAILAKPNSPVGNVSELLSDVRAGSRMIGTSSTVHPFIWNFLAEKTGLPKGNFHFVNYKAPPPQVIDVGRGDLDYGTAALPAVLPFYGDGRINIVAVTSPRRMQGLPNVPAVSETIRGYEFVLEWGLVLPKGIGADIVQFYVETVSKIVLSKEAQDYFKANTLYIGERDLGPKEYLRQIEKVRKQMGLAVAKQ